MTIIRALIQCCLVLAPSVPCIQAQSPPLPPVSSFYLVLEPAKPAFQMADKRIAKLEYVSMSEPLQLGKEATIGCSLEKIHIEREGFGEPEKTELHRHLLGDFRPGDGPGLLGGSCVSRSLTSGSTLTYTYDMARYYNLSQPGNYTVFMEIFEVDEQKPGGGSWVKSNVAHFQVQTNK